ncbi:MAG TPA: hypothetical protein ENF82_01220 [Candidatus Methanomethylia archaeon]|nr:hypothetical protein [Candidatus Verstraetearchaeota archaeon]HDI46410.1 hypothetical protein [Candidatus Methanomethylicia archaeon]
MSDMITCPYCGFRFSLMYSRVVECSGCREVAFGRCGYARCPKCHREFPLSMGKGSPLPWKFG